MGVHQISEVIAAIEDWQGRHFDKAAEFTPVSPEPDSPSAIHILFFFPQGGPGDDNITSVFTAGLSAGLAPGESIGAELIFMLKGKPNEDQCSQIARSLAELAVRPFREGTFFEAGRIFPDTTIPPFGRMNSTLIAMWDPNGECLPDLSPAVILLMAVPVFASEIAAIRAKGEQRFLSTLRLKNLGPEDYDRPPAF